MDLLILDRVAAALADELTNAVLDDVRSEPPHRVRLIFHRGERPASLVLSVAPGRPWVGRPAVPRRGRRSPRSGDPFAAATRGALHGSRVERVETAGGDRRLTLRFAGGTRLVAELVEHRATVVLVDPSGAVVAAFRRPRRDRDRLEPGRPYCPSPPPPGRRSPFELTRAEVAGALASAGGDPRAALRAAVLGLGRETVAELVREVDGSSAPLGEIVIRRVEAVASGALAPVIEVAGDADDREAFDPYRARLLPWPPVATPPGCRLIVADGAAATCGLYHDRLDEAEASRTRVRSLVALLDREIDRVDSAARRAHGDQDSLGDPRDHRRMGEALLAGLTVARRVEGGYEVPDPWSADGAPLFVPAAPAATPTQAAEVRFTLGRRAERGVRRAAERREALARRGRALAEVRCRLVDSPGPGAVDAEALEGALRDAGLAVGLGRSRGTVTAGEGSRRPAGVRLMEARDGTPLLVGKSGRDNHRLTFGIAGPEDFWFHAAGHAGAHVIVRNPQRRARPADDVLRDAAAAAAWFSDAQRHDWVDVLWTRRKYVRRPRTAPPGTVTIKRSETVRVRPRRPSSAEDG